MTIENPHGVAPPPSEHDRVEIDHLTQVGLGDQATGKFIGAMAKGQHGDAPFYGHAVVIEDPSIASHAEGWEEYLEKVGETARSINNTSPVAGNVVLDITPLPEITTDTDPSPSLDEKIDAYALQIAEVVKATDTSPEERDEALAGLLAPLRDYSDFAVYTAWQLLGDRRADVRLVALEILRPFSGRDNLTDLLLVDKLLTDKAAKVFVPTYEMLREHYQNATFEDLSGERERREFTFPGTRMAERIVKMSAAIPRYEYATRNRKN